MGEIILETNIKRMPGMLYYCGTNDKGYIVIGQAVMARGRGRKKIEPKKKSLFRKQ